jgi:predicted nucleotidyltransferase component of viral defense system
MKFTSATQLKDWLKNKSKKSGIPANVLLRCYMMERLLERVSLSRYRENIILKGGFLIAAMVGIDRRSTMDMDTTLKGLPVNRERIMDIISEIVGIDADDGVSFEIQDIKNIRDISVYDDFRASVQATFHPIRVDIKVDITIGDAIIPCEIEYNYKLMFGDRTISVMAYNIYTILAEKIETILSRNVTNTRGRDFYDTYILLSLYKDTLLKTELLQAIRVKAEERDSVSYIKNHMKHLHDIRNSPEIAKIWISYAKGNLYVKGIALPDILALITGVFE